MNLKTLLRLNAATGAVQTTEKTEIGNPATFTTDVKRRLKGLTIPFESAGGITGLHIWNAGANLFSVTVEQGTINESGDVSDNYRLRTKEYVFLKKGDYSVSVSGVGQVGWVRYNLNKEFVSILAFYDAPKKFTLAADSYVRLLFRKSSNDERVYPENVSNLQVEVGNASTYEAYSGEAHEVTWEDSVTKGSFDAVTGVLTEITPTSKTVQLSPVKITTKDGANTIWTDTSGDLTIKYLKKT